MPVSSLLLTPHHCGVMSSPAERRITAAKSKVSETRPVVGRVSLGPADRPPGSGAAIAAKQQRDSALPEPAELTLCMTTSPSD